MDLERRVGSGSVCGGGGEVCEKFFSQQRVREGGRVCGDGWLGGSVCVEGVVRYKYLRLWKV